VLLEALESRHHFAAIGHVVHPLPPRYDHVVVVVEENKSYSQIIEPRGQLGGVPSSLWWVTLPSPLFMAPFIRHLADQGASLDQMHGIRHPSEPNYLALFSGSTQGVTSDAVPAHVLTAPSLGGELLAKGLTFKGYSEDLLSTGSRETKHGLYTRSHNPWSDFADVPAADNVSFNAFPSNFADLPTVSFVVPNRNHDMHSATIREGDRWLESNIGPYARWAKSHNSLLIVTWDEGSGSNHVPTIFYGAHVKHSRYAETVNHYNLLRTIEDMYGLAPLGNAASVGSIRGIFSHEPVQP
jgi:acid phosphatase